MDPHAEHAAHDHAPMLGPDHAGQQMAAASGGRGRGAEPMTHAGHDRHAGHSGGMFRDKPGADCTVGDHGAKTAALGASAARRMCREACLVLR